MPADNPTLEAALGYAQRGWRVINIYPPSASGSGGCQCAKKGQCPSPGKHPVGTGWQLRATVDAAQVERWFAERPDWNLGIKFGADSNLVDVECDSEEGERQLGKLLGDDPPLVPTYSARRGKHRLFKFQAGLPDKGAVKIFLDGTTWRQYRDDDPWNIEVRLGGGEKGAQSVAPPSRHALGAVYTWLPGCSPEELDPVAMPPALVRAIVQAVGTATAPKENSKRRNFKRTMQGVDEGGRNDAAAAVIGKLLSGMLDPNNQSQLNMVYECVLLWNEKNNPPMSDDEINVIWASILGREQSRRIDEAIARTSENWITPGAVKAPRGVAPTAQAPQPPAPVPEPGAEPAVEEEQACNAPPPAPQPAPPRDAAVGDGGLPEAWRLVVVNSEPKLFELWSPFWAGSLTLTAEQLDSWAKIRLAAMATFGEKPRDKLSEWRDTKRGDKGILSRLFDLKQEKNAPADTQGTLVIAEYILNKVRQSPILEKNEDGGFKSADINHKVYRLPEGGAFFSVQDLQAEAKREGHTWNVKEAVRVVTFYGGVVKKPKIGTRQERGWQLGKTQLKRMEDAIDNSVRLQGG